MHYETLFYSDFKTICFIFQYYTFLKNHESLLMLMNLTKSFVLTTVKLFRRAAATLFGNGQEKLKQSLTWIPSPLKRTKSNCVYKPQI